MASPTPKSKRPVPPPAQFETIDPKWLVKALSFTLLLALFCAYVTFCFLFYHGQGQLVLHPARTTASPSSIAGTPYELIRFGPDESAIPQRVGWWIPASPNGRYAQTTLLFLPGADGSLADSIATLATLHSVGINIFAFDYRDYGQSAVTHPSQQSMTQDAEAAWQYLITSRHIAPRQIVPYGIGVGASLATHLAIAYPAIPALILDSPHADLLDQALRDPRSNLVPVRLLFHDRFPLAKPLASLHTPKLLISYSTSPTTGEPAAFRTASAPKSTVELASHSAAPFTQAITRFLDQTRPEATVPTPAPTRRITP